MIQTFMEEILTLGLGELAALCLLPAALLSLLILLPAGRKAAGSVLRRGDKKRRPAALPLYVLPAVGGLCLLVPGAAILHSFKTEENLSALVLLLLLLASCVLTAYPICVRVIQKGYEETTQEEVETARTLGMSEAAIRKELLCARSSGRRMEAYVLTLCRILAELLPGMVTASLVQEKTEAALFPLLLAVGRSTEFWEALLLSAAILLAAFPVCALMRRIGKRRENGT